MKKLRMFLSVLAVVIAAGSVFAFEAAPGVPEDGYLFNGEECVKEISNYCDGGTFPCKVNAFSPQLRDNTATQCGAVLWMSAPPSF